MRARVCVCVNDILMLCTERRQISVHDFSMDNKQYYIFFFFFFFFKRDTLKKRQHLISKSH